MNNLKGCFNPIRDDQGNVKDVCGMINPGYKTKYCDKCNVTINHAELQKQNNLNFGRNV